MREILFKGKRTDNGEWVEGCLVYDSQHCSIRDSGYEYFEVEPETVGQYTGMTDKNGKKIFEGDIVNDEDFDYCPCEILFDEETPAYWAHEIGEESDTGWHGLYEFECLIIGNIHDKQSD